MRLVFLFVILAAAACGGRIEADDTAQGDTARPSAPSAPSAPAAPLPPPTSNRPPRPQAAGLFVPDDAYCARAARAASVADELRPRDSSEDVAVVELSVAQECTGAGGEYLLARDLHGSNRYWLGGHGCVSTKFLASLPTTFGVVRYVNTSSVLTIPGHVCVAFPGEEPGLEISTPTKVRAVAVFKTQADAETFAASVRR